ncbi:DUF6789 family protein [Haloarchaeobius litoreus]|uniref:DUF6789 family protein n=1 Tax=Haloarchaeobius litoreus TaxID=755306 RepID=A0ABD6DNG8_9EURY|nr:DUF6789 family protein [Haloarchaeobius litoreus]
MDPVRSTLSSGFLAAVVLIVLLLVADVFLGGPNLFVFSTFMRSCAVATSPNCGLATSTATLLTFVWFFLLFAIAWPLLFAGFTWGLPGKSGITHGVVFAAIVWLGYAVSVFYGIGMGGRTVGESIPFLIVTFVAYAIYGLVLGGGYDYLAAHRTFLSAEDEAV